MRGKLTSATRVVGALNPDPDAIMMLLLYFGYPLKPSGLIGAMPMRFVVQDDQLGDDDATEEPTT